MAVKDLVIESYLRRPFQIDAVQVTAENMADVAEWCDGEVISKAEANTDPFIKVKVNRALNERQRQAFVGDWVLYAGKGYKVYTPKAFSQSFEPLKDEDKIHEILDPVVHN